MTDNRVFHEKQVVYKGAWAAQRGDYSGAAVVTGSGSGDYGEAALKGNLFHGASVGLTLLTAAGNIVGATAAQSVTATNTALYNPSSDKIMLLQRVVISIDSGTLAAGGIYHGVATANSVSASISGAAAGTNAYVGGATSSGRVFTKATASTYTGAGLIGVLAPIVGTTAAAITTGLIAPIDCELKGAIAIPPGCEYRPVFAAVGTTVIFNVGYTWTEVPTFAS
jgi:hypothetical protein